MGWLVLVGPSFCWSFGRSVVRSVGRSFVLLTRVNYYLKKENSECAQPELKKEVVRLLIGGAGGKYTFLRSSFHHYLVLLLLLHTTPYIYSLILLTTDRDRP